MTELANNPVYQRLIRSARGLSRRAAVWLFIGLALVGLGVSVANLVGPSNVIVQLRIGSLGLLALLPQLITLPLALYVSALIVARQAADEDFALLRLSNVLPADIVNGYFEGLRFRFRLWKTINLGLLPAGLFGVAYFLGSSMPNCMFGPCNLPPSTLAADGLLPALIGLGVALGSTALWWNLAHYLGIWLALANPRSAGPLAASAGMIGGPVFVCSAAYLCSSLFSTPYIFYLRNFYFAPGCALSILAGLVIPLIADRWLRDDCVQMLERRLTSASI